MTDIPTGTRAGLINRASKASLTWDNNYARWIPDGVQGLKPFWGLLGLDNNQFFLQLDRPGGGLLTVRSDRGDVPVGEYGAGHRELQLLSPFAGSDSAARRQVFVLRPTDSGFYTISSQDGARALTAIDGGLVHMTPVTGAPAQQWSMRSQQQHFTFRAMPESPTRHVVYDALGPTINTVVPPPNITSYARPNPDTTPEVLLGITALPSPLVQDPQYPGQSRQQAIDHPWYLVRRYGFYRVGYYYDSTGVDPRTETQTVKVGLTSTNAQEIERTTGISVTSEAGFAFKGLSASVSTTYSQQLRTLTSSSTTQDSEKTISITRTFSSGYRNALSIWYRADRYTVERPPKSNPGGQFGDVILEWETTLENDTVERSYAPDKPRTS
ncbi:hypothetical protein [Streptomyces sp. NPDC005955]|uniref:hypothetical protein n=1 Tax=Streptomyces sp. NPDC005955 TaxID=3364738 RepID=UPI0036A61477